MNDSADERGPRLPSHSDLRWMHQRPTLRPETLRREYLVSQRALKRLQMKRPTELTVYSYSLLLSVAHIYTGVPSSHVR